jgi:hypothetical protein
MISMFVIGVYAMDQGVPCFGGILHDISDGTEILKEQRCMLAIGIHILNAYPLIFPRL